LNFEVGCCFEGGCFEGGQHGFGLLFDWCRNDLGFGDLVGFADLGRYSADSGQHSDLGLRQFVLRRRLPPLPGEDGVPVVVAVVVPEHRASAACKNTWLAAGSCKHTARFGSRPGKLLAGTCTLEHGRPSCSGDEGIPVERPGKCPVGGKLLPGGLGREDVVGLLGEWKLVVRRPVVVVSGLVESFVVVAVAGLA